MEHPRTQRFMRELHGFRPAFRDDDDPDVRRWRRVGAVLNVAVLGLVLGLLVWAAVATS